MASISSDGSGNTLAEESLERDRVLLVKGPEGALSLELVPLREGVARAYLRFSPRNLKPSPEMAKKLSDELGRSGCSRILLQDSKKRLVQRTLAPLGWTIGNAVPRTLDRNCSMVTTYDLPIDERLIDSNGGKPDISNTSQMSGISMVIGERKAWAFYTDDGDTARVVSEGARRQGLLVAETTEDMSEAADCLVRFLVTSKKSWAVFSTDLGRFVRKYDPIAMYRMVLDRPKPYDHKVPSLSSSNRKAMLRLFSEYYDESLVQSMFRLRRYRLAGNYEFFAVDGGFAIVRFEGDSGLIFDIYVTPGRQGEGLGVELMRASLTALAGRVSSVYLHTSYPRAKRLYEKFGFSVTYSQLSIRLDEVALTPPDSR